MQTTFGEAYAQLNDAQRAAVDAIDGPLLVIAGPGTGKTQLLSTRAANIVNKGAVSAGNILCLTYTEAGASEMRQRLTKIMGTAGGDVAVHTFHSFGSWLIGQYPDQFSQERSLQPLDDLTRYTILSDILKKLPFRHQLAIKDERERFIRQYAVEEAIRAFKQAGLTPAAVRKILLRNQTEYTALQPLVDEIFASTLSIKRLDAIADATEQAWQNAAEQSFSSILLHSLQLAIEDARAAGKTAALGKWRATHTTIKEQKRVLKSAAQSQLLDDVVTIYETYQKQLAKRGRYDYEDMVLWAADALERHPDLQLDIAERFQYIMVDEYQDTNGAQNRLLTNLAQAHPLDSPNVMVVGDDDQAIMRFQGAELSGMLSFVTTYKPRVIVLQDNYRSSQAILDASRQVMTQTDERLEVSLPEMNLSKTLAAKANRAKTSVAHYQYISPIAEYTGVAERIAKLIRQGVKPSQIGVIGRKHAELTAFVPHLTARKIAVAYDRREDILQQTNIVDLLQLARLVVTLAHKPSQAQTLLPGVLAAPYWKRETLALYQLAATAKSENISWLDAMLREPGEWHEIAEWLLAAAQASLTHNFTQMFDILLGRAKLTHTKLGYSPYAHCYQEQPPSTYITILSHLLKLRSAVLENRPSALGLDDLLEVADQYAQSDIRLVDDNPILRGDSEGVQVMSAHSAKGREFEYVIILSAVDEVWGNRARSNNQRIFLPENLPLYPAGDAESDRLRLLYVAMTRAKSQLILTSYTSTDAGKASTPLSYLALGNSEDGWWLAKPATIDEAAQQHAMEATVLTVAPPRQTLLQALQPALTNYHLSSTALRDFLDLRYSGPAIAVEKHVLKFPSAYNASSALGNATHRVLQLAHTAWQAGNPLSAKAALQQFDAVLDASGLAQDELTTARAHGHQFLPNFLAHFSKTDFAAITATEQFLTALSPTYTVPLNGAIDALAQIDDFHLRVIDYKTGTPPAGWHTKGLPDSKKVSLHFYKQQLLFYKLLVDNSSVYANKQTVQEAELIFVESDEPVRLSMRDDFTASELERTEQLIKIVYERITSATLPDTSRYSQNLRGIIAFEDDLLSGNI